MPSITLYVNSSENNRVTKSLSSGTTFTCDFKDQSSIYKPSVLIGTSANLTGFNYAEISDFNRKYFITDIVVVRAGLYLLKLKTDVLSTWGTQVLAQPAVIARQSSEFNLYLDDPEFKVYNNKQVDCYKFSSPFSKSLNFILTVAGD